MRIRCDQSAAVIALTLLIPSWPAAARAQDFATVTGKERIPRGGVSPLAAGYKSYKSWSLFLVTNQSWLTHELASPSPQGRTRVNGDWVVDLYERSHAFGRVIGDDHLAVWFWKESKVLSNDSA